MGLNKSVTLIFFFLLYIPLPAGEGKEGKLGLVLVLDTRTNFNLGRSLVSFDLVPGFTEATLTQYETNRYEATTGLKIATSVENKDKARLALLALPGRKGIYIKEKKSKVTDLLLASLRLAPRVGETTRSTCVRADECRGA